MADHLDPVECVGRFVKYQIVKIHQARYDLV